MLTLIVIALVSAFFYDFQGFKQWQQTRYAELNKRVADLEIGQTAEFATALRTAIENRGYTPTELEELDDNRNGTYLP